MENDLSQKNNNQAFFGDYLAIRVCVAVSLILFCTQEGENASNYILVRLF